MMRWPESKFARHFVLKGLNIRREKLYHLTALSTDHVIVVFVIIMVLVIRAIVAKSNLARKPGLG